MSQGVTVAECWLSLRQERGGSCRRFELEEGSCRRKQEVVVAEEEVVVAEEKVVVAGEEEVVAEEEEVVVEEEEVVADLKK